MGWQPVTNKMVMNTNRVFLIVFTYKGFKHTIQQERTEKPFYLKLVPHAQIKFSSLCWTPYRRRIKIWAKRILPTDDRL